MKLQTKELKKKWWKKKIPPSIAYKRTNNENRGKKGWSGNGMSGVLIETAASFKKRPVKQGEKNQLRGGTGEHHRKGSKNGGRGVKRD